MKKMIIALAAAFLTTSPLLAQTREIVDDAGRTVTIPETPMRIIALHEALLALPLLELGMDVVGVYGRSDDGGTQYDVDFIESVFGDDPKLKISGVGPVGNMDLEKFRALKPDLIIGMSQQHEQARILSAIAPVYLQTTMSGSEAGFSIERELAEALGRQPQFKRKEAEYQQRVSEVRAKLPEDPKGKSYLAIIVFDQISAVRDVSGAIQAVRDLGYEQLDIARNAVTDAGSTRGFAVPLSSEAFPRLNPDILVVMNSYMSTDHSEAGIRARLDAIAPGWDRFMPAARDNRIIFLDSASVATPTIESALHTLRSFEEWSAKE